VEDQVPLDQSGRCVAEPAAAEVGVNSEPLEERDAAAPVADLETERARRLPAAVLLYLDQEAAELLGMRQRAVDLVQQVGAVTRSRPGQKRRHLFVRQQLDEKVDVLPLRAARRRMTTVPEPSATPARINASPASADQRSGSPRIVAP